MRKKLIYIASLLYFIGSCTYPSINSIDRYDIVDGENIFQTIPKIDSINYDIDLNQKNMLIIIRLNENYEEFDRPTEYANSRASSIYTYLYDCSDVNSRVFMGNIYITGVSNEVALVIDRNRAKALRQAVLDQTNQACMSMSLACAFCAKQEPEDFIVPTGVKNLLMEFTDDEVSDP